VLQSAVDAFVMDLVGKRIAMLLGTRGRTTLRRLVARELAAVGQDPRPEIARLKGRLAELVKKADAIIDLAAASSEDRDLLNERLGRLRLERRDIEGRLRELELVPVREANADEIVDSILEGLADARRLFDQGTMEERKRVVRAFIETLTVVGSTRTGEIRMKKLPALESLSAGSSVESVAGVRCEARQSRRTQAPELILLTFTACGTALVPARGVKRRDPRPVLAAGAGASA
jgi:hypothetical protein